MDSLIPVPRGNHGFIDTRSMDTGGCLHSPTSYLPKKLRMKVLMGEEMKERGECKDMSDEEHMWENSGYKPNHPFNHHKSFALADECRNSSLKHFCTTLWRDWLSHNTDSHWYGLTNCLDAPIWALSKGEFVSAELGQCRGLGGEGMKEEGGGVVE